MHEDERPEVVAKTLCKEHMLSKSMCKDLLHKVDKAASSFWAATDKQKADHYLYIGNRLARSGQSCRRIYNAFIASIRLISNWPKQTTTKAGKILYDAGCGAEAMSFIYQAHRPKYALLAEGGSPNKTVVEDEHSYQVRYPKTTHHRLRHDVEQLTYLLEEDIIPADSPRRDLASKAKKAYDEVLSKIDTSSAEIFRRMHKV